MDGVQDLGLCHLLAPADELAVVRVLLNKSTLFFGCAPGKADRSLPDRVEGGVLRQDLPLLHETDHVVRDGIGCGKAGGLDADKVYGLRGQIVPDLDPEILDHAVLVHPLWKDPGVGADIVSSRKVRPELLSFRVQVVDVLLLDAVPGEVVGILRGGTEEHVAVGCHRDVDAHVGVRGHGVDRHRHLFPKTLIEDDVVILRSYDVVSRNPQHVGDLPAG